MIRLALLMTWPAFALATVATAESLATFILP
jgi:hypothetical protein